MLGWGASVWVVGAWVLAAQAAQDTVSIQLQATWNETPRLLEASELLSYESPALFWWLADAGSGGNEAATGLHARVDVLAAEWLPPLVLEVFRGELLSRGASAAVEAQLAVSRDKVVACGSSGDSLSLFAEVNGEVVCAVPTVDTLTAGTAPIYENDHVYPLALGVVSGTVPTVILYGALGTAEFHAAHTTLASAAAAGKVQYIVRHHHVGDGEPLRLAGFGVELDVKKMDYVATDDTKISDDGAPLAGHADDDDAYGGFNFKRLGERYPAQVEALGSLKAYVKSTTAAIRDLKAWELQDIGIQAASRIVRSSDPAAALQDISQNFPILASLLVRETVNASLQEEAEFNRETVLAPLGLDSGSALFAINGLMLDAEKTDLYTLFSTLRADAKLLNGLRAVGFPAAVVPDIMSLPDSAAGSSNAVVDFRHSAVQFMNDLERDARYRAFKWSSSMQDLLRPAMPGAPRFIAKNMWHALFIVDPASPEGTSALAAASQLIHEDIPVRFGFLFTAGRPVGGGRDFAFTKEGFAKTKKKVADGDAAAKADTTGNKAAVQMIRAYSYIAEEDGPADGFAFLTKLAKGGNTTVTTIKVKTEFVKSYGEAVWSTLLKGEPKKKHDKLLRSSEKVVLSFGLSKVAGPLLLLNGERSDVTLEGLAADELTETLTQFMAEGMPSIQRGLYYGQIAQDGDVLEYLMTQPSVVKRLNARVTTLDGAVLDFAGTASEKAAATEIPTSALAGTTAASMKYFEFTHKAKSATFWVIADFNTAQGQRLAFEALRRQLSEKKSRVAFVHNGAAGEVAATLVAATGVLISQAGSGKIGVESMGKMLATALNGATTTDVLLEAVPTGMQAAIREAAMAVGPHVDLHAELCRRGLQLEPGSAAVVINGQVVGPLGADEVLIADDFKILEKAAHRGVAGKMLAKLAKNKAMSSGDGVIDSKRSNFVMAGTALLQAARAGAAPTSRRLSSEYLEALKTSVVGIELGLSGEALAAAPQYHDILLIVDPLSKGAQHAVPLVRYLATLVSARVRIVLNPVEKLSEAPLKRFYRTVLPVTTEQAAQGKHATAAFTKLPTAPLLTLGMHVPAAWLVQAFECPYDLDNIHLESTPNGVHAIFKLENILVEGRCYEDGSYQPTPGLQLQLHPVGGGAAPMDTLVMANLGYFQLKANPGVWQLGIRPGRSLDVYDFKSVDDVGVTLNVKPNVVLNSFTGTNIQVTMERRPGMETAKLLDSGVNTGGEESGGLWGSLSGMMGGNDEQGGGTTVGAGSGRTGETINVFSLASGHLYERFLKIMMLSVLKNTNNPVKFWFLKNCMSPQLQEFLPHFAVEYGFSYELVQYKWPSWLNLPPTKHRQIWGYKILFLDTLFPLNVNKIIFVDADQVVRADLNELLEIDLEGAPYAYTPFCDDRKEMDGFRFWNSGYWKGHLDGRPYHISALYVVDLIRFRQLGAGDRLREQYQGLSRDPNSLSNLDQDLPNNMVHQVPIKSLPQEWLWCETWCSDGIKGAAKTIDLCNNPLTKEPKLDAAVRIVSEWSDLDSEARNVTTWVETKLAARQAGSGSHGVKDEL